jgi:hypothetical protein
MFFFDALKHVNVLFFPPGFESLHSGGENGHEHRDVPWSKLLSLLG